MKKQILFIFTLLFSFILNGQENEYKLFSLKNSFLKTEITSIVQDKIGYLYIATKNNGIIRFNGNNFEAFGDNKNVNSSKNNILFYKNDSLLIASNNRLSIKANNQISNFKITGIEKVYHFKNQFYFLTKNGVEILTNKTIKTLRLPPQFNTIKINDIAFFKEQFWLATTNGILKIDNLQNPKKIIQITKGNFTSILKVKNQLITNQLSVGLLLINKNEKLEKLNDNNNILKVIEVNTEVWLLLNNNGIEVLNATNFSFIRKINKYNSLQTNKVNDVFVDRQKTIWFSTDKGLYATNFNKKEKKIKPSVFLTEVAIDYKPINLVTTEENKYKKILKPNQNYISFHLKTVDLIHFNAIEYRYKLNNKFSPWSKNSIINFANLPAGNYTFSYQSKININESEIKQFVFIIEAPFYKKTIFYVVVFIAFLIVISLVLLFNFYRIRKKNKAKITQLEIKNNLIALEQKAMQLQMNPHFIFNVLNGIKAFGIAGNKEALSATISKFSSLLRGILSSSNQEEISLQNEIDILKNYISLAKEFTTQTFDFTLTTKLNTIDADEILIPPMLIQPFVENSIQHAFKIKNKENKIEVVFEVKNSFLHCFIKDNGVGIYQNQKNNSTKNHKSLAIEITKQRIKNISKYNVFEISELKEKELINGTQISFKIPLKTDY